MSGESGPAAEDAQDACAARSKMRRMLADAARVARVRPHARVTREEASGSCCAGSVAAGCCSVGRVAVGCWTVGCWTAVRWCAREAVLGRRVRSAGEPGAGWGGWEESGSCGSSAAWGLPLPQAAWGRQGELKAEWGCLGQGGEPGAGRGILRVGGAGGARGRLPGGKTGAGQDRSLPSTGPSAAEDAGR